MTDLTPADPARSPGEAVAVSPDDQSSDRAQSDSDHSITVGKLDELKTSSDKLIESNREFARAMIDHQERARLAARRFRITLGALIVVLALILAGFLALLAPSRGARDAILDCVQPEGHCFKSGQARTGAAVAAINAGIDLAAACAPSYVGLPLPQRIVAIRRCVETHLPH